MKLLFLITISFFTAVSAHLVFAAVNSDVIASMPYLHIIVNNKLTPPCQLEVEIKPENYYGWDGSCSNLDNVEVFAWGESKTLCHSDFNHNGIPAFPAFDYDPSINSAVISKVKPSFKGEIIISSGGNQIADIHYSLNYHFPSIWARPDKYFTKKSQYPNYVAFGVGSSYLQWDPLIIRSQDPNYSFHITDRYNINGLNYCYFTLTNTGSVDNPFIHMQMGNCSVFPIIDVVRS